MVVVAVPVFTHVTLTCNTNTQQADTTPATSAAETERTFVIKSRGAISHPLYEGGGGGVALVCRPPLNYLFKDFFLCFSVAIA